MQSSGKVFGLCSTRKEICRWWARQPMACSCWLSPKNFARTWWWWTLRMPCMNGIEAAREIQRRFSNVHVVILTMHADRSYIDSALDAGVCGYVLKEEDIGEMYVAIRYAALGTRHLSTEVTRRLPALEKSNPVSNPILLLTGRERQVFQLIAEGKTNNETAQMLGISVRTVEVHRAHMMEKLNLKTHIDFIRFALQHGILADEG